MKHLFPTLILVFFCASASLSAQKLVERTVCVFDFAPLAGSDASYGDICADTVSIELERLGYILIPNETTRKAFKGALDDEAAILGSSKTLGADVAVFGFYIIEGNSIRIGIKAYDIITSLPAIAVAESGLAGIDVFETIDSVSAKVAKRIRDALAPMPESEVTVKREKVRVETTVVEQIVEKGTSLQLTLQSKDEGAQVFAGDTILGLITSGTATIETKDGTSLSLVLRKKNYYDKPVNIRVSSKKPIQVLPPMIRETKNELDFSVTSTMPLGLKAVYSWFPAPDLFATGASAAVFYTPLGMSTSFENAAGAILIAQLYAHATLFPLAIFQRAGAVRPYLRPILGGMGFFTMGIPETGLNPAMILHAGGAIGCSLPVGRFRVFGEFVTFGPPILYFGTSDQARNLMIFQLSVGMGYIW